MKLYEYKEVLWSYGYSSHGSWVIPFCPTHKIELDYNDYNGFCEKCNKSYSWQPNRGKVADYLRREIESAVFKEADIISIDGIQTPQVKTRVRIPDENKDYWIEGKVNKSSKGRQLVLYVGEKGLDGKAQIFVNIDQEKLSFDHKDRKPEDIISKLTVEFPSSKKMIIDSAKDSE